MGLLQSALQAGCPEFRDTGYHDNFNLDRKHSTATTMEKTGKISAETQERGAEAD